MSTQLGTVLQRPRMNYALFATLAFVIAAVLMIALAVTTDGPTTHPPVQVHPSLSAPAP